MENADTTPLFSHSTAPLSVSLLILPDSSLMSLASVLDVMRAANRLAQRSLFNWQLISVDGRPATLTCAVPIPVQVALHRDLKGDVLILIGGFNQEQHVDKNALRLLQKVMPRFRLVGGVEAGSWLLARSGRLDGRKATTHWEDLEDFRLRFPQVDVRPDRFVIDGDTFTTGGASPSFDFMLYLIRQRYGHHLALEVASVFIYDGVHTASDAQPFVSLGLIEIQEPRVAQAIRLMEQHIDDTLSIVMIATQLQLSVRTLEYLFTRTLQIPPAHYYLQLRLQTARRLVMDTRLPLQEIAVRTGFGSLSAFSRRFKQLYQLSPGQCRRQRQLDGPEKAVLH